MNDDYDLIIVFIPQQRDFIYDAVPLSHVRFPPKRCSNHCLLCHPEFDLMR